MLQHKKQKTKPGREGEEKHSRTHDFVFGDVHSCDHILL